MSKALPKWDDTRTATLVSIVGDVTPVTAEVVAQAAESLETTTRSVASKLRKMDYDVESTAKATGKSYTEAEEAALTDFLNANPTTFTYAEIAAQSEAFLASPRTAKQIQGKILSMELFGLVKPTEKVERPKSYTDEEEVTLRALVVAGEFIEDIAEKMNREIASIRGKVLSMSRVDDTLKIPKQRVYKAKKEDAFTALGDVSDTTVEEIAAAIEKTERGVKTLLTHRGISCKDYDGAKRHAKNAEANA